MSEIKIGEYIRYKDGHFDKITGKYDISYLQEFFGGSFYEKVASHSFNIIDLIEVGDYVNGKLVSNVDEVDGKNYIEWENRDMYSTEIPNDKFIKGIVTKEQFAAAEYKLDN